MIMSLDGVNGQSIQTLLRGGNDSKQLDEIKAGGRGCWSGESVSIVDTAAWCSISDFISSLDVTGNKKSHW